MTEPAEVGIGIITLVPSTLPILSPALGRGFRDNQIHIKSGAADSIRIHGMTSPDQKRQFQPPRIISKDLKKIAHCLCITKRARGVYLP
jgi:hypothetical protein